MTIKSGIISGVSILVILAVAAANLFYAQDIRDWWKLRNYKPSSEIVTLSAESSFSEKGQKLFYVHDPELLPKELFASNCQTDEQTIVLGCYVNSNKIYVFDVEDPRIAGVEEVTAAHEMLHAAYDRLSSSERSRIDDLTSRAASNVTDQRVIDTIENYRSRDPSVVPNELHSILGTEVRNLPDELEQYYSKYFISRVKVVDYAEKYATEFASREEKIAQFDATLTALNIDIQKQETILENLSSAIESERTRIAALLVNPSQYNSSIPGFNRLVQNYNSQLQDLRSKIERYNVMVVERNSIATEEKQLFDAIDSRQSEL